MVNGIEIKITKEESESLEHILGKMDFYLVGHLLSGMGEDSIERVQRDLNRVYAKLVRSREENEG